MTNITDRLKTSTPSLLPREEWPMSKGPWTATNTGNILGKSGNCPITIAVGILHPNLDTAVANARFIAACNSEPPLVETLWELFETYWHCHKYFEEYKLDTKQPMLDNKYLKTCLRLLTHLDAMSVIRWTPEEGE